MNSWNQAPLVRLVLPFLMGIITAIYFPVQFQYGTFVISILTFLAFLIILIPQLNSSYKKSWWFGLFVNMALFTFAYQLSIFKTEKFAPNHFSKFGDSIGYAYVRLTEPPIEKERSLKVIVEIAGVKQDGKWKNTRGKAMVYFQKSEQALKLNYGDGVIMKVAFREIAPPQNPGEFDYKRFLSFHNINQQAYVKSSDWVNSGDNTANMLIAASINLRNSLLNIFSDYHIKGKEFVVGSALLLGYEDKLDADIISAYSNTGALHILSVSGLHVAIVYIVFNWLLFFLDKINRGNIIKAVLLILLLWSYAALSGLSPPVLRAATMFSFIVIAKAYNRSTNIYNTLAASAFVLLLINPFYIMTVGFQLSYLAVIGIVFIQPKMYNLFKVKNWPLDQVWIITSVSIAAQIATLPLCLYYFHQFPNYFLLSNLIVIPVSTAVIYLGIALFAFAKIPILASYLAMGFNYCVWFLNQSVIVIEKLPYALLHSISITAFEMWLLYGLIMILLLYFTRPKFNYLVIGLCLVVVLLCSQLIEQHHQYARKKLIIYNIPKTSAIDFISAKHNILLTDSIFAHNKRGLLFHMKNNWCNLGINQPKIVSENIKTNNLLINNNFIQFYDTRIAIVNEPIVLKNKTMLALQPLLVDYLIISKNPSIQIADIMKQYTPKNVIFDSSNSLFRINKWKAECVELNQSYYSVMDSGALVVDL